MNILVNQKLIQRLRAEGFYPDTLLSAYFAMHCLARGETSYLDHMDDFNKSKRMILVYHDLIHRGLWQESDGVHHFEFTEKGRAFFAELDALVTPPAPKKAAVEDWFAQWYNLWPKGVEAASGYIRSDEKTCLKKLKAFVKDYGYDKDVVLKATAAYLMKQQDKNWAYTLKAVNFIHHREKGSELAVFCEEVGQGKHEGLAFNFSEPEQNFFI